MDTDTGDQDQHAAGRAAELLERLFRRGDHEHHETHGAVEPILLTTRKGIKAVAWSFVILTITAVFQVVVVLLSGSVALLADTLHNFGDILTAIPLLFAFRLARRPPNRRFTYGYGRAEDLAGVFVVLVVAASAVLAGYESIQRIFDPLDIEYLWAIVIASVIGFAGNEAVALYRIRVGKEIGSAALVADGYHARVDGLTSLAVLLGALGVWLGYPLADPIVGLIITLAILRIVWNSGKSVFTRLMDGVEPGTVDEILHAVAHVEGVKEVTDIRVRWLGHRMTAEVSIGVSSELSVEEGHDIAVEARHQLLHHLRYLSDATIHVDPECACGTEYHLVEKHEHDGLPEHTHP